MPPLEHLCGPSVGADNWSHNVILLNGIKGQARGTWTPSKGQAWWQKFSEDLGNATILSYDVPQPPFRLSRLWRSNENPLEQNAREIVADIGTRGLLNRKTMFIGYSFGGILLKRMIAEMRGDLEGSEIPRINVIALAFLGVPHQGSRWAKTALYFLRPFGTTHIKDAKPRSRTLLDVDDTFRKTLRQAFGDVAVISLLETRRMTLGTVLAVKLPAINQALSRLPAWATRGLLAWPIYRLVVEQDSATLGLEQEVIVEVDACHLTLPWFVFEGAEDALDQLASIVRPRIEYDCSGKYYFQILTQRIEGNAT
jgi:hypothetical protein